MKQPKNFGLTQQERPQEKFDHWDLGFISKKSVQLRQEQRKAETDSLKAQTDAMQKILSEPTPVQEQGSGVSTRTAVAVSVIVVLGLLVGYSLLNKKKKSQQAAAQENTLVVDEIL